MLAKAAPVHDDNQKNFILHYDKDPVNEYNNPDLFPGMFPTLYPLGIGGFECSLQNPQVSIEAHAQYLLDQPERTFRYHHFFPFVILNVIQRRKAHLHTSLSVSAEKFQYIAPSLLSVTPSALSNLAQRLKSESSLCNFSDDERKAFQLLHEVNIVSAKIPGSQASKLTIRHQLQSYFGYFGLPHLWFTYNPSAVHSPVFQVFYGNRNIDLSERYPDILVPRSKRAYCVAKDPVAAADFFDFMFHVLFQDLFGWDFKKGKSCDEGGIFGHLRAFYGCAE
ncbi:hypothetical protein FB446DRAFT_631830, partial [Lentinula raphanica]